MQTGFESLNKKEIKKNIRQAVFGSYSPHIKGKDFY
jgi:hypothetical protein